MKTFEQMQKYLSIISNYIYFDKIISLGSTCQTAYQLKRMGFRNESYPFDWLFSLETKKLVLAMKNDFKDWCLLENLEESESQTEHRRLLDTKYNMIYQHHFPKEQSVEESYDKVYRVILKRVKRLMELKNSSQKVLFVRTNTSEADSDEDSIMQLGKTICDFGKDSCLLVINHTKKFSLNCIKTITPNVIITEVYDMNDNSGQDWRGYNLHWNRLFDNIRLSYVSVNLDEDSLFEGFYSCESECSDKFRWMAHESLLHLEKYGGRMCKLEFISSLDIVLEIYNTNGKMIDTVFIKDNEKKEYIFQIEHETRDIKLVSDKVWRPCDYLETDDKRLLSARLNKIWLYN